MQGRSLYSTSQPFMEAVGRATSRVYGGLERAVSLVEVITLPDFGQRAILRFELAEGEVTSVAEADALEVHLRALVGNDFWATLPTRLPHLDGDDLVTRLDHIDRALPVSLVHFQATQHSAAIQRDGGIVRAVLKLPETCRVFEIETPASDPSALPIIRIADTDEPGTGLSVRGQLAPARFGDIECIPEVFRYNPSFSGCVKAYAEAKRRRMALNSYIVQFE